MKGQFSTDIQGRNPNVSLMALSDECMQRLCRAFPADDLGPNTLGSIFDFIKQKRRRVTAPLSST
jgi:hypothetical protein